MSAMNASRSSPIFRQRHRGRERRRLRFLHFGRQIADVDLRPSGAQRNGPLDGVFQLTDVARPRVTTSAAASLPATP